MGTNRRHFIRAVGGLAAGSTAARHRPAEASTSRTIRQADSRFEDIEAFAFDAYGTLFDVFSVTALCEELFPTAGNTLAQRWRAKQLQYSLLRSLMGRHRDFWQVTEDGLVYAARSLGLDLTPAKRRQLMDAYLGLAAFADVKPGLEALRQRGRRLAILSNGEPRMLEAAARSAGIDTLLDEIVSVEDIKIFKVSPRAYNLGLERLGVSRTGLGFVSSNSWDVNGAGSAGLTTFWIQRSEAEPPEELGFPAHGVVRTITELASLVA